MQKITDIRATQILDSRGNPTIKAFVKVGESWGNFSVPSGASTGVHEALELRDGGKKYLGQGVSKAIANIEGIIKPALVGLDASNQRLIDETMITLDGTENKSKLGANAILAVSGAVTRAVANSLQIPYMNIFVISTKIMVNIKPTKNIKTISCQICT
jgi:enolase